ncbi:30S ribosomal protein S8e [archaeon]|nr:30S ribosomal protein S8e [archaeon]|tara:strand:- start:1007 stop:1384 length:378 start_codon:yes stop_codon:yes gene_type:complete
MAKSRERSKRKITGGLYRDYRKKRKYMLAGVPTLTRLDKIKLKKIKTTGGNKKVKTLTNDTANVYDSKQKKCLKLKIKKVLENPANRHFVRRNILTKGTIIETEKGKAIITSRVGQEGTINAKLL